MNLVQLVCFFALFAVLGKAHFSFTPSKFQAGASGETFFKIGHGCDGSPTVAVKISFPSSVFNVKAQAIAGWNITYEKIPLSPPVSTGHSSANSTVKTMTFTAFSALPDDQYLKFYFSFNLRKTTDVKSNLTLIESAYDSNGFRPVFINVSQVCVSKSVEWNQIQQGSKEPDNPAPILYVSESPVAGTSTATSTDSNNGTVSSDAAVTAAIVLGSLGLFFGVVGTALSVILLQRFKKI
jgi:periplasmic copper chaperone A